MNKTRLWRKVWGQTCYMRRERFAIGKPIHDRAGAVMYQSENDSRSSLVESA